MLLTVGLGLIFASVFWVVYRQMTGQLAEAAKASLQVQTEVKIKSLILKYAKRLYRGLIMMIARQVVSADKEKVISRRLISAGITDVMTPIEFMAFKILLGVGLPLAILAYRMIANADISLLMIAGLCVFGWFYPDLWTNGLRGQRRNEITLALPFVIDLLTLSTEAGLDFMGAMQKVVDKARPSPLVQELDRVIKEVQLGSSRGDALRNMAWRVNIDAVSSLIAILVTSDQMGASMGPVLRAQSDMLRSDRFMRAEKAGAAASQKILFPLIFLILPAVFIMIFGPVVLQFVYGGRGGGFGL
jgi:tight adherence protein C